MASDVVHHLYSNGPAQDLIPYCGVTSGRDESTGEWDTGRERDELLTCLDEGLCCCMTCLSPEALGGWTPLITDEGR